MSSIRNTAALTSHGDGPLRWVALEIAAAGLRALDPVPAVEAALALGDGRLVVGGREWGLGGKVVLLGAGKASLRAAQAVELVLGDHLDDGLIVVRRGEGGALQRATVLEADHPLPSEASRRAGERMLGLADGLGPDDLALCCITGGSSALLSMPPEGVAFEAKRHLHELLLESGVSIFEINTVRKHVSAVKGGRLAARIAPATILNLTVSDVAGDALDFITGPTVQDTTTPAEAVGVLQRSGLWDRVHPSVREHLLGKDADSPLLRTADITTCILLTGDSACRAMVARAEELGYRAAVLSTTLGGEAVDTGRFLASVARECLLRGRPVPAPCVLVGCGGESTVSLTSWADGAGAGGPNQEVALGAAMELHDGERVAFLSIDTDGSDGGTASAGGIVDGETLRRTAALGRDIRTALQSHRAMEILRRLGDLVDTGPTGTNVNDLFVAVVGDGGGGGHGRSV